LPWRRKRRFTQALPKQYNRRMNSDAQVPANWPVIGHDWAVDFLRRSLAQGRNRHAYLITGPDSVGKMKLALAFAQALNCEAEAPALRPCGRCRNCQEILAWNAPDVIRAQDFIQLRACKSNDPPCRKCLSCRQISSGRLQVPYVREYFLPWLRNYPYALRFKIVIYDRFHLVPDSSQDILLKTFEEPPPSLKQIILTDTPSEIRPTIRSRAQIINLRPVPHATIKAELLRRGAEEAQADLLARLCNGRVGWALRALEDETLFQGWQTSLDRLRDVLAGGRLQRLKIAERMGRIKWVSQDGEATVAGERVSQRVAMYTELEIWQSYWRDVLLECYGSPVKICNSDRRDEIRQLAQGIDAQAALRAMQATRRAMDSIDQNRNTNANPRLVFDALFLDYPGLE